MVLYNDKSNFDYTGAAVFSSQMEPGAVAPYGGIYKCRGCGHMIGIAQHHTLPSQNHHQHSNRTPIRWQPVTLHN